MKRVVIAATLLVSVAVEIAAQQPDSVRARQIRDSIALVRELERMRADTTPRRMGPQAPTINPRLMPDLSAIADIVGDFSPKGSTQEDGARFSAREVELAIGANVDPYFRADFILGLSDLEGIAIEEAYGTALALPAQLQLRVGRFHMPVGKQNTTHRAELHTLEYPYVIQRFLGAEALKGTGLWVSKILAPFGFYQELQLTAVDRFGEAPEGLVTEEPVNKELSGLTGSARLRNYWDFSESSNLELSFSALTGKRERFFPLPTPPAPDVNAIALRQSVFGADATFRWRPLEQGLYKSLIVQAEFMRQMTEDHPALVGRNFNGAYGFARWQLTRRLHLGGRYDWLEDPDLDDAAGLPGETFTAGSGYLEWFPSEFSKLVLAYERAMPTGVAATNRILLQATFAVGPHRPHPF